MDIRVPFKRTTEGIKDADKARDKIFRFIDGKEKFFNDIGDCMEKAVKEATGGGARQ